MADLGVFEHPPRRQGKERRGGGWETADECQDGAVKAKVVQALLLTTERPAYLPFLSPRPCPLPQLSVPAWAEPLPLREVGSAQ